MHFWFQDLRDEGRHWLFFRGSFGRDWDRKWLSYEFHTGPSCSFRIKPQEHKTSFTFGILFFTLFLSVYGLKLPFLRIGREYGFYWFEWAFWAFFGRKEWESSSKDPWYYRVVIHPLDILFGRTEYFEKDRMKSYGPILFKFRGETFQMDEIRIANAYWFKTRVPFALWKRKITRMHLDIKNPPKYAGKGENSYDCGDDASYGLCCHYDGPTPVWKDQDAAFEYCCKVYCENVSKSLKRYGRASGDPLPIEVSGFKYIGRVPNPQNGECASSIGTGL